MREQKGYMDNIDNMADAGMLGRFLDRSYSGEPVDAVLGFLTDCANGRVPAEVVSALSEEVLWQLSVRGITPERYWAMRDDCLLLPYDSRELVPDTVTECRKALARAGRPCTTAELGARMRPGARGYSRGQLSLMRAKLSLTGRTSSREMGFQGLRDLCDAACDRVVWTRMRNPYAKAWGERTREFLDRIAGKDISAHR